MVVVSPNVDFGDPSATHDSTESDRHLRDLRDAFDIYDSPYGVAEPVTVGAGEDMSEWESDAEILRPTAT